MPKKRVKKKTASRKKSSRKVKKKSSIISRAKKASAKSKPKSHSSVGGISHRASHIGATNTEKILIENFVSLQKVMVNLSVKFDNLSSQISKLLELFEISAKALAEKEKEKGEDNKELIEKLDNILEQNKVIARGVALVHEMPGGRDVGERMGISTGSGSQAREMPRMMPEMKKRPPQQPQGFSQQRPMKRRAIEQEPDMADMNQTNEYQGQGESQSKFREMPEG